MSFSSLLIHTCTIEKRAEGTVSNASYGHGSETWSSYATGVRCRLMNRKGATGWEAERVSQEAAGAPVSWHIMHLDYRSDLVADGAEAKYRFVDVRDRKGDVLDAGPFNIRNVFNAGGQQHHLEVAVIRQPVEV